MPWKGKEKEYRRCRRPEWATAHFESSIAIEKVYRDRVPLTLCRNRVICVATGRIGQAHDWVCACVTGLHARLGHVRDRNPWPRFTTGFLCRDRIGVGNGRLWVAIEVFLVAT